MLKHTVELTEPGRSAKLARDSAPALLDAALF